MGKLYDQRTTTRCDEKTRPGYHWNRNTGNDNCTGGVLRRGTPGTEQLKATEQRMQPGASGVLYRYVPGQLWRRYSLRSGMQD